MFKAWDLSMLTHIPDKDPKVSKSLHRLGREVVGDVTNKRMSSAKRAHLWVCGPHFTPLMFWLDLIAMARTSIANANIRGERGHPCLVPLAI